MQLLWRKLTGTIVVTNCSQPNYESTVNNIVEMRGKIYDFLKISDNYQVPKLGMPTA